jgi:uncharacterized protein
MNFPSRRPPQMQRCFTSRAVDAAIDRISRDIADPELAWLFANCLPNTLDATVTQGRDTAGRADTFVITGDIDAMWLRDSTAQVWPYLSFLAQDDELRELVKGVINRQAACVRLDPYANAFLADDSRVSEHHEDQTEMRPGVHERKYELDSLCAVLRLAGGYWEVTGDVSCFDEDWLFALGLILETIRIEQGARSADAPASSYRFARFSARTTDSMPLRDGLCYPTNFCGLSRSPFRPSDDACQLPFNIPANALAVVCLRHIAEMLTTLRLASHHAAEAKRLAEEIDAAIKRHAIVPLPARGAVLAYEIDGYGSHLVMDDANVPSLLSLPYIGWCKKDDRLYKRTRALILGPDNPYYCAGTAGTGVGSPHIGSGWIWPISVIMQALTSESDDEIRACLLQLKSSHAGSGFMHESYWQDDPAQFTRHWFAWANSLFGELILTIHAERPHLLRERF